MSWFNFGSDYDVDEEVFKLKSRYGKEIRVYDERDPVYFKLEDNNLPIPIELTFEMERKMKKKLEKQLLSPFVIQSHDNRPSTGYTPRRKYAPKIRYRELEEYLRLQSTRKTRIPIPEYIKNLVVDERGPLCEYCREKEFDHFHHINNDPSDNRPENLLLLCYRCHKNKHAED